MKEQYRIAAKRSLTPEIGQISVEAPLIAAKAKAGQFIILRVDEAGAVSYTHLTLPTILLV